MDLSEFANLHGAARVAIVLGIAIAVHMAVRFVRQLNRRVMEAEISQLDRRMSKVRTVATLLSSSLIFLLYFGALGVLLHALGISVTAYLASASIIGLAVAFGSQGMVQDVVMGVTIVFSDLFNVGDMVEISGQVGIVRRLGMRFTVLVNAFGAEVFIPNRSLTNVIRYQRTYVRCIVDITLSPDQAVAKQMEETAIRPIVAGVYEQFPGILRTEPDYEGRQTTSSGRHFLRVKFRIWPGRGAVIENDFRKELLDALKKIDPAYADWMVSVSYEVERRAILLGDRTS